MFTGNKVVQMIGYTPESVKKIGVRLVESGETQELAFSARKLIIALARTILALQPKDPLLIYQAISSYSALYPLISDGQEFGFIEEVDTKVRDYLLSTRTGELAPAMGYLFAQQNLEKPFVADFSAILHENRGQAFPDLVALDTSGNASFIESKGSRDVRNKGKLREALLRSEAATDWTNLMASDFYALFISVTKSDKDAVSAIHYTHTANEAPTAEQDVRAVIYRHYATWFNLLGYTQEATSLTDGQPIELKKLKKTINLKKQTYYILDTSASLFFNTIKSWDDQFVGVRFAISAEVLDYLRGGAELLLPKTKHVSQLKREYDLFADGTLLVY